MRLRGIRVQPNGHIRGYLRCQGQFRSRMFPAGTPFSEVELWRRAERLRLLDRRPSPSAPCTFADDARAYLAAVKAMPTYAEREQMIQEWVALFGTRPRAAITPADIRAQLATWTTDGYAASSVNHRRTALMHLWSVLDGKHAPNPVREVPKLREPEPQPRGLALDVVTAVLAAVRPGATQIRLRVLATTGLPHSSLARLKPEYVDAEHRCAWIDGRRKGGGTRGRWLPLTTDALAALADFAREDLWGPFSRGSLRRTFRLACQKVMAARQAAGHPVPALARARPYDLRHSLGERIYALTGDIRATQELLGHSTVRMTERYARGAISGRALAAVAALDGGESRGKVAGKVAGGRKRRPITR